jgi:hypothetical protein
MVGTTTLGDAMILAAIDRTPSPQTILAGRCLKRFIERITKRMQPPLLELLGDDTTITSRLYEAKPAYIW